MRSLQPEAPGFAELPFFMVSGSLISQESSELLPSGPEERQFRMDPNLLYDVITKQAGTIGKALLEGVMNSIDAGARSIQLLLRSDGFVLADSGRGFQSEDEIDRFFATFGTPHRDGDARFGRFRMGRGQLFAFAETRWCTREFVLHVDIKKWGLAFRLARTSTPFDGCRIEGRFYEALSAADLLSVESEIQRNCLYVDVPLSVNGRIVSKDPSTLPWDHVLPDAWITLASGGTKGIAVYQQGVFVETIPATEFGLSGTVVTRPGCELRVNFARNQVLRSCPRFKAILALIDVQQRTKIRRRTELDDSELESVWAALKERDCYNSDFDNARFLEDTTGRCWAPRQLRAFIAELQPLPDLAVAYSVGPLHDQRADRCMQRHLAFVLSERCFVALGGDTAQGLVKRERIGTKDIFVSPHWLSTLGARSGGTLRFVSLAEIAARMKTSHELLDETDLTKREVIVLQALKSSAWYLRGGDRWSWDRSEESRSRTIRVGVSDVASGWTDGHTYIAVERGQLRGSATLDLFFRLATVVLHEYCHEEESGTAHEHSPQFYRTFHDRSNLLGLVASDALDCYRRLLREAGKTLQSARLEEISSSVQRADEQKLFGNGPDETGPEAKVSAAVRP